MYIGEYRHQIDEKGRIRIPPRIKAQLNSETLFITRGPNRSLIVMPEKDADAMFERMGDVNTLDPVRGKSIRLMAASGFKASEDKTGRILLPASLIKHAGLTKNIVTIGAYDWVEIWNEANWDAYSDIDSKEFDSCLSELTSARGTEK